MMETTHPGVARIVTAALLGLTVISALCINFILQDITAQEVFGVETDFDDA